MFKWKKTVRKFGPYSLKLYIESVVLASVSMSIHRGEGYTWKCLLDNTSGINESELECMRLAQESVLKWLEKAGVEFKNGIKDESI